MMRERLCLVCGKAWWQAGRQGKQPVVCSPACKVKRRRQMHRRAYAALHPDAKRYRQQSENLNSAAAKAESDEGYRVALHQFGAANLLWVIKRALDMPVGEL